MAMRNKKMVLIGSIIVLLIIIVVGIGFCSRQEDSESGKNSSITLDEEEFEELFENDDTQEDGQNTEDGSTVMGSDGIVDNNSNKSDKKDDNSNVSDKDKDNSDKLDKEENGSEGEKENNKDVLETPDNNSDEKEKEDSETDFTESEDKETGFGPIL